MSDDYPHTCGDSEATCIPCFAQALSDARDAFEALPDERQKLLVEAFDKAQAAAQFHAEYRR